MLSSYQTGNLLPAWAPVRVVIGLGTLTAGISTLQPEVECFYQPNENSLERQALLASQGVSYVFWGPEKSALGDWDPASATFLTRVFHQGDYWLFKVR